MSARTRLDQYFKDYAAYHRNRANQLCHYFGVTAITVTLLGLLGGLPIAGGVTGSEFLRLDAGTLLLALTGLWYLVLDWRVAVPFLLSATGLYFFGRAIPTPALWAIFVLGWIVQFVGHYIFEKNSPAFFKQVEHLLIGPIWVFARSIGYGAKQS